QATPAFRNRADELADRDYVAGNTLAQRQAEILTQDVDGNNKEGEPGIAGETIPAAILNHRNHRTDIFSFFARGLYHRQTGNTNPDVFVSDMSSREAWIWYGHLW